LAVCQVTAKKVEKVWGQVQPELRVNCKGEAEYKGTREIRKAKKYSKQLKYKESQKI
jgi:hypothetical protein